MPASGRCARSWTWTVAADPTVDYGWWPLPSGLRARLSWNVGTGILYLHSPAWGATPLVACGDREAVEGLLAGIWEGDAHGSLQWLADRLWLVGATLPDWALPLSREA